MKYGLSVIKGVIARLKAVTAFTDVVSTRVYTDVPQGATFPYSYVEVSASDWSWKDNSGSQFSIDVHIFSRAKSVQEAMTGMEAAITALDRQEANITLDSGTLVLLQKGSLSTILKETDGITWQGVVRFNALIQ